MAVRLSLEASSCLSEELEAAGEEVPQRAGGVRDLAPPRSSPSLAVYCTPAACEHLTSSVASGAGSMQQELHLGCMSLGECARGGVAHESPGVTLALSNLLSRVPPSKEGEGGSSAIVNICRMHLA